jgi:hypothetical protein
MKRPRRIGTIRRCRAIKSPHRSSLYHPPHYLANDPPIDQAAELWPSQGKASVQTTSATKWRLRVSRGQRSPEIRARVNFGGELYRAVDDRLGCFTPWAAFSRTLRRRSKHRPPYERFYGEASMAFVWRTPRLMALAC